MATHRTHILNTTQLCGVYTVRKDYASYIHSHTHTHHDLAYINEMLRLQTVVSSYLARCVKALDDEHNSVQEIFDPKLKRRTVRSTLLPLVLCMYISLQPRQLVPDTGH
jgi:hypothetical protein